MKKYSANEIRNIAILGHGGCGKTTISEACLFVSGAIKRFGKVDEGNTVSDYDSEEVKRKVSINTSVIPVEWEDTKINLLDTPGYFDFVGEAKLALSVVDSALIVVSGKSGIEVGTEKAWEYADEMNVPKIIFINQMDDENADFNRVLEQLRETFGKAIVPMQIPFNDEKGNFVGFIDVVKRNARKIADGKFENCDVPAELEDEVEELRAMLVETAAESDDELIEKFFNDEELTVEEIYRGLKEGILANSIAPVMCGAASLAYGIKTLMNTLVSFLPAAVNCRPDFVSLDENGEEKRIKANDKDFVAFVFKTISDPYVGRLNIFRVLSGSLKKDMVIYNVNEDTIEKASHIYVMKGKEQIEVDELSTGDIGALAKLTDTSTQDTLCTKETAVKLAPISLPESVMTMAIVPKGKGDEDKISSALSKIKEEDPTIKIEVNPETKQSLVYGIGEQHLDILISKLKTKYKIEAELVTPIIPYRETIKSKVKVQGKYKKQSGGHGQFGDVWMEFEPSGDMLSQYIFEEKIFGGSVPKNFFPAVEKGLQECINTGVLAGYPVVGLKATLVDGSYHPVDSSEMAFKMATSLAFKDGVAKAKPTILEPIVHMEVLVPEKYMGDIMGDINKRRGRILSMGASGSKKLITAEVPQSEIAKYSTDLRSMTQSRGSYSYYFERYDEAPAEVQQKVIELRKKEKEA
ncbi:MAG: elongation factor G [Lachnospiraceae bacterium]|nr:elongation factor G [Lachnospiraceae bacterium]